MRVNNKFFAVILTPLLIWSCTKDVVVELPPYEKQIVVEGKIEEGEFPLVILTRSQGYYEPINGDVFSNLFIKDADVKIVVNNTDTISLIKFCTDELPDSLKILAAQLLNLPTGNSVVNICIYTTADPRLRGKAGNNYDLLVNAEGKSLSATTTIFTPVPLDTLFWKVDGKLDSLGFLYSEIKDPAMEGNSYRWFAQRINSYNDGKGEMKDQNYISPFGSVFDDEFVNNQVVEFGFVRGQVFGSTKLDDNNIERGYFKRGDTIAVKFATIDKGVYQYYRTYYNSLGNSGSPFASPANITTNIKGGLGVWAGYGLYLDTLVVK